MVERNDRSRGGGGRLESVCPYALSSPISYRVANVDISVLPSSIAGTGHYVTLLKGVCVGFFMPFLPLFFFRTQIFSRRQALSPSRASPLRVASLTTIGTISECKWPLCSAS